MPSRILPFARGTTLYEGATSTDNDARKIIGQCHSVPDVLHGSGGRVSLRVVQQNSGSAQTLPGLIQKFVKWQTGTKDEYGTKTNGYQTTYGAQGKPVDDYYSGRVTSVVSNDVMFVVDRGPCKVLKTSTSFTAGQAVAIGNGSRAVRAAAGDVVVGFAMTTAGAAATNMVIYVEQELRSVTHHA